MRLTKYVTSREEARRVLKFRRGYVEEYGSFLAKTAKLTRDSAVLDVPCGAGGLSAYFSRKLLAGKIICMDINKSMIREAKRNVTLLDSEFIVGDAAEVSRLVEGEIDAIFCINGFHQYIQRKMAFLRGCEKILRSSGVLIFDISTRGLNDEQTREYFKLRDRIAKTILRIDHPGKKLTMPAWPDRGTIRCYIEMIKRAGLAFKSQREFKVWKSVKETLEETLSIPGRSRPWIKGLNFKQRADLLTKSAKTAEEKLGVKRLENNRIFLVAEKK